MRLTEIEQADAAERRTKQLKVTADAAMKKAKQLKSQATLSSLQQHSKDLKGSSPPTTTNSSVKTIKPHN